MNRRTLRVALGQINCTVGDVEGNARKILDGIEAARAAGAELVVFPEMAISGYPPEDLLLSPSFLSCCGKTLEHIAHSVRDQVAVIGFPERADDLYNSAAVICNGAIAGIHRKHFLPNYGVFDEDRYFKPGSEVLVFRLEGTLIGVSICEDIWYPDGPPMLQAHQGGAEVLINVSASPYHAGKRAFRERMLATRAADNTAALCFCNLVGGQDELVFDGGSSIFDARGQLLARGRQFAEDLVVADLDLEDVLRQRLLDPRRRKARAPNGNGFSLQRVSLCFDRASASRVTLCRPLSPPMESLEEIYSALVLGTGDYVRKNGFEKIVLGISGGMDSSLVACIAADALGKQNVVGVVLGSRYSSEHSREDATQLAQALGIQCLTMCIEPAFQACLETLAPMFADRAADVAEENLQARIRGLLLMALSNKFGWLVLTTGNKSEMSAGYATLYGDMAGGFAVIKDVPKTLIYSLARFRNQRQSVIPERVFIKAPSAELRPEQKDSDALPEYAELDPILNAYVEQNRGVGDIVAAGYPSETVRTVVRMVDRAEYKRRQAPPGIRITPRAFGKDRRLPITNHFWEEFE